MKIYSPNTFNMSIPSTAIERNYLPPFPRMRVILMGDAGVGKTTFIHRHLTGNFERPYTATPESDLIQPIPIQTNRGTIVLDIVDCSGQNKDEQV